MSKKLAYLVIILAVVWAVSPAFGQPPAGTPGKGKILFEYFYDITGVEISTLTTNAKFPDHPDYYEWNDSFFAPPGVTGGGGIRENYGIRGRAYVYPPQSGDYTFWVAGDDLIELWLSTDDKPANAKMIANITGWTQAQDWAGTTGSTDTTKMKSVPITLKAGQKYYIEGLLKEQGGGESIGAAWSGPGIAGPLLLAGKYCSAWIRSPEPMFWARNPNPADGATGVMSVLLQWTKGGAATQHKIYFGADPASLALVKTMIASATKEQEMFYYQGTTEPDVIYYWRIDEIEADKTVRTGPVWSFTTAPLSAFGPVPRNGDKWIDPNMDLTWQAGTDAQAHDVYFSTNKDLVANRDASVQLGNQIAIPAQDLPLLQQATTYYWLVDEYDSMGEKHEGEVWSFTTKDPRSPGGVKAEYFANTALSGAPFLTQIEQSIDQNWGANGPTASIVDNFSARWTADLEITGADTYTFIATTAEGVRVWINDDLIIDDWVGKSASDVLSNPIKLQPGIYSLTMEYYVGTASASAQLSWMGNTLAREVIPAGPLQPPVHSKAINPKDGDVNVPQDITLMWSSGEKAVTHEVYFGTDKDAVAAATPGDAAHKGSQAKDENTFVPGALEWGKTYYWRVDEVNSASTDSPWKGAVSSFTTANFIVVDNFESYTDNDVGRIFQTWIDGWGYTTPAPGNPGNGTGSTVGYVDPPFAEHVIVHGGGSSMPLGYNNADSPFYSEAERTFDSPQNWTVNGVNTLSMQVRGYPQITTTAVTETGGKMNLTGDGSDIWNNYDDFTFAYKTLSGDGSIVAKVTSVGTGSQTWAKGGVMIRDSLDGGAMDAYMIMTATAGNGASFGNRPAVNAAYNTSVDATTVVAVPYWVKIERVGDSFNGYVSSDGSSWTIFASADVVMSDPVYIGVCITSHLAGEQRTFQFESIKTTGNATGSWQGAAISSPQYNSAQNLYVALQDSTGKVAVATDATAVNSASWVEVKMPLSSFSGVSASKIKKIFIGVGSRTSPAADGTGMLFIDDIRVIKQ
jgi:hypothetical protein